MLAKDLPHHRQFVKDVHADGVELWQPAFTVRRRCRKRHNCALSAAGLHEWRERRKGAGRTTWWAHAFAVLNTQPLINKVMLCLVGRLSVVPNGLAERCCLTLTGELLRVTAHKAATNTAVSLRHTSELTPAGASNAHHVGA